MPLRVLFVDMNAYFASVEQQHRPALRGRPIAVIPMPVETTCCIAASYEARPFGIKTGTPVRDARRLCPGIVLVEARHELYVRVHHLIRSAVDTCLPIHRVHSIDEMSCRLAPADQPLDRAVALAQRIKRAIRDRAGEHLRCSIGLAPNVMLAKVASDMHKPDGLTDIASEELPACLHALQIDDFPGIGPRMRTRLERRGIHAVAQLCACSPEQLEHLWGGVVGRRFWHALHGDDIPDEPTRRRTVGHSHVLPPDRRSQPAAQGVLIRMLCKAAARMRRIGYCAGRLDAYVTFLDGGGWKNWTHLPACQDTQTMIEAFSMLWEKRGPFGRPLLVGVVLSHLQRQESVTPPLFREMRQRIELSHVLDRINGRYGRDAIHPGAMHTHLDAAPTRIAFSNIPDIDDPSHWTDEEKADAWRLVPRSATAGPRELRYEPDEADTDTMD